ncbi:MAG: oligosaccharide flippase family protein [Proteobacteria bacterium]|nr:oligosaccharide flippase family protein [Pseudomonadota bacterium]
MSAPAPPGPSPEPTLARRAARGALVNVVGQGAAQGLRLLSNLILSRLLFPEAFGLMELVRLFQNGLQMVSNVGIQPALIRHARGEERDFLDTAWTLQLLRGCALWACGVAIAWPVAAFYGEPQLTPLLAVATFAAVLQGLFSTKLVTETRGLRLGRVVASELAGQAAALVAMVVLAWWTRSVWALVAGGLVAAAVRLAFSHWAIPGPGNRLRWDRSAAADILSFGKWIFVSTLFTFLALRLDVALLGKLLPLERLGVYSIGILLAGVVRDVSGRIIQTVLMPALAASHRKGRDVLVRDFRAARGVVLPVGLLAIAAAGFVAPAFFSFLYDARYADAGWIAQLSMLAIWWGFLHESSGRALLALGDSRSWALSHVVKTLATGVACVLGYRVGELPGLILGVAAGAFCGNAVVAWRLQREGFSVWAGDVRQTLLGLALAAAAWWLPVPVAARLGFGSLPLVSLGLGIVLLAPIALLVARRLWPRLRST